MGRRRKGEGKNINGGNYNPKGFVTNIKGAKTSYVNTVEKYHSPTTATNFSLNIPDDVYSQIMHWVNRSNNEVSWFGTLTFDEKTREFTVGKIALLEQEVSSAETEIDANSLARLMYELKDEEGELKWWGHSHVNMDVFWSGQDMHTIRDLGRQGWILASVFNKREEIRTAYLQQVDVLGSKHDVFVDDIKTNIERYYDQSTLNQWDKEYDEKVKSSYTQFVNYDYSWNGWDDVNGNVIDATKVNPSHQDEGPSYYFGEDEVIQRFYSCENFWDAREFVEMDDYVSYYNTLKLTDSASIQDFIEAIKRDNQVHTLSQAGEKT